MPHVKFDSSFSEIQWNFSKGFSNFILLDIFKVFDGFFGIKSFWIYKYTIILSGIFEFNINISPSLSWKKIWSISSSIKNLSFNIFLVEIGSNLPYYLIVCLVLLW